MILQLYCVFSFSLFLFLESLYVLQEIRSGGSDKMLWEIMNVFRMPCDFPFQLLSAIGDSFRLGLAQCGGLKENGYHREWYY